MEQREARWGRLRLHSWLRRISWLFSWLSSHSRSSTMGCKRPAQAMSFPDKSRQISGLIFSGVTFQNVAHLFREISNALMKRESALQMSRNLIPDNMVSACFETVYTERSEEVVRENVTIGNETRLVERTRDVKTQRTRPGSNTLGLCAEFPT